MSRARVMADLFGRFGMAGGRLSIDSLYAADLTSSIVKDEGDMATNSTIRLVTQRSVKTYVDAVDAAVVAKEGALIKSTGESGGVKFLREDGDGTSSWQTTSAHTPEGTVVLSTGETGGTKFLREDGDNSSSWQTPDTFTTGKAIAMAMVFGG